MMGCSMKAPMMSMAWMVVLGPGWAARTRTCRRMPMKGLIQKSRYALPRVRFSVILSTIPWDVQDNRPVVSFQIAAGTILTIAMTMEGK